MTIIGGGSFAQSVTNFDNFLMSNEAIKKLSKNNLTYYVNIKAAKGKTKTVQSAIENIEEGNELFRLESYEEVLKQCDSWGWVCDYASFGNRWDHEPNQYDNR